MPPSAVPKRGPPLGHTQSPSLVPACGEGDPRPCSALLSRHPSEAGHPDVLFSPMSGWLGTSPFCFSQLKARPEVGNAGFPLAGLGRGWGMMLGAVTEFSHLPQPDWP